MRYYYSLQSADDVGEHEHPETVIRKTFPDATNFDPRSVGDCWFFEAEERDDLPPYILPRGPNGVPIWDWHQRKASIS